MQSKRYLRPKQIAAKFGISLSTYYLWVRQGKLPRGTLISQNVSATPEHLIDEAGERLMAKGRGVA